MPASKFTKPNREKILVNLRKGMPLEAAAAGAGVGRTTVLDWKSKAEAYVERRGGGEKLTVRELAFVQFADDLAEAIAYGHYVLYVWWFDEAKKPPMKGNWQAPERMLERRFRDDYRISRREEISGPGGKPIEVTQLDAVDVAISRLLEELGAGAEDAPAHEAAAGTVASPGKS